MAVLDKVPACAAVPTAPPVCGAWKILPWTLLSVSAALPSLVWLARGAAFLTDDFGHALVFEQRGLLGGALQRSFESTGRPLVGFYYAVVYGVIGTHPALHALVMAVLNVALVLVAWRVGHRFLPSRIAFVAALLLAAAPNRASTRLWFATGQYTLATIVVLIGFAALAIHWRPGLAALLLSIGTLLFEGTAGLVAALVGPWIVADPGARTRVGLVAASPAALAASGMYLISPKRGSGSPSPAESLATVDDGLLGSGLWVGEVAGLAGQVLFLLAALVALVTLLPSFRRSSPALLGIRVGLALTVLGALPFVVAGSPFAAQGIFDRTNLVPLLGVCVVLASLVEGLRRRWRSEGALALLLVIPVAFVGANLEDVDDYAAAASTGHIILDRVLADVDADDGFVIVAPPDPGRAGVASFVYPKDLLHAVELAGSGEREVVMPWSPEACATLVEEHPEASLYRWDRRVMGPADPERCEPGAGG